MPIPAFYRLIGQYVRYAEEGGWTRVSHTPLPTVILVCNSLSFCQKLDKIARHEQENSYSKELAIIVTTKDGLMAALSAHTHPSTQTKEIVTGQSCLAGLSK